MGAAAQLDLLERDETATEKRQGPPSPAACRRMQLERWSGFGRGARDLVALTLEASLREGGRPSVKILRDGVAVVVDLVRGLAPEGAQRVLETAAQLGAVESRTGRKEGERCWLWLGDKAPRYELHLCGYLTERERAQLDAWGVFAVERSRLFGGRSWVVECATLGDVALVGPWLRCRGHAYSVQREDRGEVAREVSDCIPVRDANGANYLDARAREARSLVAIFALADGVAK
jgi:hypothetical protein